MPKRIVSGAEVFFKGCLLQGNKFADLTQMNKICFLLPHLSKVSAENHHLSVHETRSQW